jgi:hypothetical protein
VQAWLCRAKVIPLEWIDSLPNPGLHNRFLNLNKIKTRLRLTIVRLRVNALSTQNVQVNSDSLIVAIELWNGIQFNLLGASFLLEW